LERLTIESALLRMTSFIRHHRQLSRVRTFEDKTLPRIAPLRSRPMRAQRLSASEDKTPSPLTATDSHESRAQRLSASAVLIYQGDPLAHLKSNQKYYRRSKMIRLNDSLLPQTWQQYTQFMVEEELVEAYTALQLTTADYYNAKLLALRISLTNSLANFSAFFLPSTIVYVSLL
jgi:hypothetical protein